MNRSLSPKSGHEYEKSLSVYKPDQQKLNNYKGMSEAEQLKAISSFPAGLTPIQLSIEKACIAIATPSKKVQKSLIVRDTILEDQDNDWVIACLKLNPKFDPELKETIKILEGLQLTEKQDPALTFIGIASDDPATHIEYRYTSSLSFNQRSRPKDSRPEPGDSKMHASAKLLLRVLDDMTGTEPKTLIVTGVRCTRADDGSVSSLDLYTGEVDKIIP